MHIASNLKQNIIKAPFIVLLAFVKTKGAFNSEITEIKQQFASHFFLTLCKVAQGRKNCDAKGWLRALALALNFL